MATSIDPQRLKLSDDGRSGALVGFQCLDCGVRVFGPATFCQSCTSDNLSPVEFGAEGTLFSYTVVRVPPAGWTGPVPYVLGEVELPEGPHVLAEVVDGKCHPEGGDGHGIDGHAGAGPPQGGGHGSVQVEARSLNHARVSWVSVVTNREVS